jgi:hypothetical protein
VEFTVSDSLLPTVPLGPHRVTRLIIGGNPFSGGSHTSPEMDAAFLDYYTTDHIKAALCEAERQGLNAAQVRADRHIMRMLREYRNEGGTLQWIAQTASEFRDLPGNIRSAAAAGAIGIYHHGTRTDGLWREGNIDELRDLLAVMRDGGVAVGVGTHLPEVIEHIEEHGWDVDFYMACFYSLGKPRPKDGSMGAFIAGEVYDDADRERMTQTIRATKRTCLAFKILAASRKCATPDHVREAFRYAFDNIKPQDAVVVGMFQRDMNQIAMNAGIVRDLLNA